MDDRLIADEFFRGSYTDGVWVKGDLPGRLKYNVMVGDNLSILGVSASQIDNKLDTQSYALQWLPTTGEFGLWGTFGDYDYHEKVATRVAGHFTHSLEDKQSQPSTNGIENSQIRLSDGSVVFTPNLFGPGIAVNTVDYRMTSIDAGVKYHGLSLEGEYYWRWLTNFTGANTGGIPEVKDNGYQLQSSGMVDQGRASGVRERLADFRTVRRRVRVPVWRELVLHEAARTQAQRRVHPRRSQPGRLHRLSDAGRRNRQHLSHQPRNELLR